MIRTKVGGSEVEIVKGYKKADADYVSFVDIKRKDDGKIFKEIHIAELTADGGLDEIDKAVKEAI